METAHKHKDVSFLVITHNNEATIKICLDSILSFEGDYKEIIVVNDHSTDSTTEILATFGNQITCLHGQEQIGIGNSKNKGLERVGKSGVLFIIDGDIVIEPNCINEIVEIFNTSPNVVGVSGHYKSEENEGNYHFLPDLRREVIYQKRSGSFVYNTSNFTTFSGGFCALNLEKIGSHRFPDESKTSAEDLIFQISLLGENLKFMYSPLLKGSHKHTRNLSDISLKALREAQGSVWAEFEILERGLALPKLEQVFSYPNFTLLACSLVAPWVISVPIILFLLPYVAGGFNLANYRIKDRVLLVIYSLGFYFLKTILALHKLTFSGYKITPKLKFISHFLLSPFLAKYLWVKREIWLIKQGF